MNVKLHYLAGTSKEIEFHYNQKQYRDDVFLELDNEYYEIYFFTTDGIENEMTRDGFFSFPGMIILDEITQDKIETSIIELIKVGYFTRFQSEESLIQSKRFNHKWYLNELSLFDEAISEVRNLKI